MMMNNEEYLYLRRLEEENKYLREEIKQAIPSMREFARSNPPHKHNGILQDPCGVHEWLNRNDH